MGEHESCPIPSIAVRELLQDEALEAIQLELITGGDGLSNMLNRSSIQKPGLALAGFLEYIHPGMIQILGKAEINFLDERPPGERSRILSQLCRQGGSCFVLTSGLEPPAELVTETDRHEVPLLRTELSSPQTIGILTRYLEDRLAPRVVIHGVLMDIYGLGVLLLGESGVGKSECALDLVVRGHRLVSDDVVEIKRRREVLVGTGPEMTRYHMELRGLGIINVKDLFGVAAVRMTKFVEYVIRLDPWRAGKSYDRLGLDENSYEILGIELPYVEMPVGPGRNLSVLIEVAARNHLLKLKGYHPARELARLLGKRLTPRPEDEEVERGFRAAPMGRESEEGGSLIEQLVVITGLSGSGKTLAADCMEDIGYFCVDNLPVGLIPPFCKLIQRGGEQVLRAALVIDAREGAYLNQFPEILRDLRGSGVPVQLLYLESSDDVLKRRFSESRRPHPVALAQDTLEEAIARERSALQPLKDLADRVIDTSRFTAHELRTFLKNAFGMEARADVPNVNVISFGFKHGVPTEADLVFDVRFLPNPHFVPELRALDGRDPVIQEFLERSELTGQFWEHLRAFLEFLIPLYGKEGKTYLTVALGCTGGKHRSVALAERLGSYLERNDLPGSVSHRDLGME